MIFAKIELKKAEKLKEFLGKNKLFDKKCRFEKDKEFLYFPIIKEAKEKIISKFKNVEIIEKKASVCERVTTLKQALEKILSKDELKILKTAYDTIGDIAIIDIPEGLEKKEKLIGEALLKLQKNIKVVCEKVGIHSGEFRTQDLKVIAGENRKETEYIENGVIIRLDVEKVYFSPRLSSERKRINALVKPGEDVLVMFSGCGPYVFNISKNTKAMDVYGIEINPIAHKYALINKDLNKSINTTLINGDVNEIVPNFYKHIIGLKSNKAESCLRRRLSYHPVIMEFHLFPEDMYNDWGELKNKISELKKKNTEIFIHMPFMIRNERLDLTKKNADTSIEAVKIIGELCKEFSCKAVIHPSPTNSQMVEKYDEKNMLINLKKIKSYFNYFYFENSHDGPFSDLGEVINIAKKSGMNNLCIDVAHAFIHHQSNDILIEYIKKIKTQFNTYFHLSDSNGNSNSEGEILGTGKIDFERILPLVNKGITEVKNKDEEHPIEMLQSYKKVKNFKKTFDRILMPLPKSAEDFLNVALSAIKPNGTIHFYDFSYEKDLPNEAIKKIEKMCKKANKKFKVINYVKCGQYSPKKFRICIDFIVY